MNYMLYLQEGNVIDVAHIVDIRTDKCPKVSYGGLFSNNYPYPVPSSHLLNLLNILVHHCSPLLPIKVYYRPLFYGSLSHQTVRYVSVITQLHSYLSPTRKNTLHTCKTYNNSINSNGLFVVKSK